MEKTYKITLPKCVSVDRIETSVEDGVLSVSVEMARENYLPNDGDFVTCGNGYRLWVIIYKHTEHDPYECCYYYVMKTKGLDTIMLDDYCDAQETMRPSTDEERQELLDALAKEGKRWNAEKKCIEDLPRWRAAKKGEYYYIYGNKLEVEVAIDLYSLCDNDYYNEKNYFKTREAAEKVASQIREIFKNSKAE